jgi:FkbH-like protein
MIARNTPDLDYGRLVKKSKKLDSAATGANLRIAILADAASQQFVPLLRTLFHENGVRVEIYEGAFDAIELEVLNPSSGLYQFRPDAVILANCTQALRARYYRSGAERFLEEAADRIALAWSAIQSYSPARIVQCNFPLPYERQFGHYDLKVPQSFYSAVGMLNARIAAEAQEHGNVLMCDVEAIASYAGRRQWFDDRLWNMSKAFCRLDHLPLVAQALVEILLSTMGRIVKCVVLDLDNTLWGGVVGDDGPNGIAIGAHGDGEAFYHFQQFLLSLQRRGILLAVCSKNNPENALAPFLENPNMVLKRGHITVFVANWQNKADNIRAIRDTLEIGFDSMVFLDDNPFERNLVRQYLPDVIVPDLPEDPADYVRVLCELNLFEVASFSNEDLVRADLYRQEAERRDLRCNFSSIDGFLQSLEMKIEVVEFEKSRIPRIAQLIQRSNQFNLTTRRHSEAECERMMRDRTHFIPLCASLSDRFGGHGLISIVILRKDVDELVVNDWLMSCRVLNRGVEQFLMNRVVEIARQAGFKTITGEYRPTAKNGMVKEFFAGFGFKAAGERDGGVLWRLDPETYRQQTTYVNEIEAQWTVAQ